MAEPEEQDPALVVLLAPDGRPVGQAPKATVHGRRTPLHLAFSCYVFDRHDRLLVTRRALGKLTWPGVWTNSCCGHPAPGEGPADAVRRRLRFELGLGAADLRLALPEFRYRASRDGVEENELCPVWLCRASGSPSPHPAEVAEVRWMPWPDYVDWASRPGSELSVWSRLQVRALVEADAVDPFLRSP